MLAGKTIECSDRYVRHPIQNILAHGKLSPQPGLLVLSTNINPYFQFQTRNKFTSWLEEHYLYWDYLY